MPEKQRSHVADSFSYLLPSGRDLVKAQIGRSLSLSDFIIRIFLSATMSFVKVGKKKWHQSYSNKTDSGISLKTAIGALGQCGENYCPNIFVLPKNICHSKYHIRRSTSERTFSTLRGIRTQLRNAMGQG